MLWDAVSVEVGWIRSCVTSNKQQVILNDILYDSNKGKDKHTIYLSCNNTDVCVCVRVYIWLGKLQYSCMLNIKLTMWPS